MSPTRAAILCQSSDGVQIMEIDPASMRSAVNNAVCIPEFHMIKRAMSFRCNSMEDMEPIYAAERK